MKIYGLSKDDVEAALISLIQNGVTEFLSGGQGGFDRLCAGYVDRLKLQYPEIKNYLVIPYLSFRVFEPELFDEIIYPDGFEKYYFKAAIPAGNQYMVDHAAHAVCYVDHGWGGAAKTYEAVVKANLHIINLGRYCVR